MSAKNIDKFELMLQQAYEAVKKWPKWKLNAQGTRIGDVIRRELRSSNKSKRTNRIR